MDESLTVLQKIDGDLCPLAYQEVQPCLPGIQALARRVISQNRLAESLRMRTLPVRPATRPLRSCLTITLEGYIDIRSDKEISHLNQAIPQGIDKSTENNFRTSKRTRKQKVAVLLTHVMMLIKHSYLHYPDRSRCAEKKLVLNQRMMKQVDEFGKVVGNTNDPHLRERGASLRDIERTIMKLMSQCKDNQIGSQI